jgi:hypothetical protein
MASEWDTVFKIGSLSGMISLLIWIVTRICGWFKRPSLEIEFDKDRDIKVWETYHNGMSKKWTRKFLNCQILNTSNNVAKRCEAIVTVLSHPNDVSHLQEKYAIHWADTPYSGRTTGAFPVDIGSAPQRLDIVFTDKDSSQQGAWLAIPFALLQPNIATQVFLPPGEYEIKMNVSCSNGKGNSIRFKVTSPRQWTDLDAVKIG